jgi:aminobenzoyl-glutamate utilization protein B
MSSAKSIALDWIEENRDLIIDLSDRIWEFAELPMREFKSSRLIAEILRGHGFKTRLGLADMPTAIEATWGNGGPVIAIQGEYDALPALSQKKVPYKDPIVEGAPGHGCGHNLYGASGVGGAIATKVAMEAAELKGTVKFLGTPAEEQGIGKVFMVRDGLYDGVDAVLGHHIGVAHGVSLRSSNALNSVKFVFHGQTSHAGSTPWQGRSALDAVELMNNGVNYMREHVVPSARIHYIIEEGGGQPNVVPDRASSWYYIRAPTRLIVEHIYGWILDIGEGAAKMTRTELEVQFQTGIYNKLPNRALAEFVVENMREIGAPTYTEEELEFARKIGENVDLEDKRTSGYACPGWEDLMDLDLNPDIVDPYGEGETMGGSTDTADVSWNAPTAEFNTGSRVLGAPGHSWMVTAAAGVGIGHKNAVFAAKVHAATAVDLLTKPELIEAMWKELKERTKDHKYMSPLPPDLKPPVYEEG